MVLCIAGFAWAAAIHGDARPADRVLIAQTTTSGSGACDVDGVRVAYASQYAPSDYHVGAVTLQGLSSSCGTGQVLITLSDSSGTALPNGSAQLPIPQSGPTTFVVPMPNGGPLARSIFNVHVELAGGTTPKPVGCTVNKFDFTYVGELTDDSNITGTNQADLIYGLSGNDVIAGLNGTDCLVGGDGNDSISGGNHNSFVDGGSGNDQITLGNANNTVVSGSGNDQIKVGNGDNKITVGTGQNTVRMGNGKNTVIVVGGESNTTCILPSSSKTTSAGLAGCKTVTRTP
jgi:Ca2+-binding RTX toxin-like protein